MDKIILFYKFTRLKDPAAVRLWQQSLGESLGLKGRLIISPQGINGTLAGSLKALKTYAKALKAYQPFKGIELKWSDGALEDFPRLSIKLRPELVTYNLGDRIKVNGRGVVGGGVRLTPKGLHRLIKERGDEVVLLDGRNQKEAAIGSFKGALSVPVKHSRDFPGELKKAEYQSFKSRPVVTYCTGGIRCEILSALLKQDGFKEVYQLDGGIVKYGQEFGDKGLWEGALYVFDGRVSTKFSEEATDIGQCSHCEQTTSRYDNCALKKCNEHVLICDDCSDRVKYCPDHELASI